MSLGTVLVVGGCGCLGYNVVKALLADGSCSSIHVFSRNPTINQFQGVQYHAGSLTSSSDVQSLLLKINPTIIIHNASPISSGNDSNEKIFQETNVRGTKTLLDAANTSPSVKAFVYTSSSSVAQEPLVNVTEAAPLITRQEGSNYYSITKAIADALVLKANNPPNLRTAVLRVAPMYGDRDNQMIPGLLKTLRDGRQNTQIGNNDAPMDLLSVGNAATAHVLAAKALMEGDRNLSAPKVDGEAFYITDDSPVHFWTFARKVWKAAGDQSPPEKVKVMPAWVILGLAITVEWAYWILTFGQRTPKFLRSHTIRWVTSERTFSVEKAKQRLGYKPVDDMDESIAVGVKWNLQQEKRPSTEKTP